MKTLFNKYVANKTFVLPPLLLRHPFICGVPLPERPVNQLRNGIRYTI